MNKSELRPDTIGQLIGSGKVFTAADGMQVIIGDTDTVAFQDDHGWQVAENVFWNDVEDFPPTYSRSEWEAEEDFEPGRKDVYFLTISDPDGEEYATIIHRVTEQFPLDSDCARRKEEQADNIVKALNQLHING